MSDLRSSLFQIARKVGDPDAPRPWSRHALKKKECEVNDTRQGDAAVKVLNDKEKGKQSSKSSKANSEYTDPELQEFLQIMQPRAKSKLWSNDTLLAVNANSTSQVSGKGQSAKHSKDQLVEKQMQQKAFHSNDKVCNGTDSKPVETLQKKKTNDIVHDEVVSDMDYFRSRVKKNWLDSDTDEEASFNGQAGDEAKRVIGDDLAVPMSQLQQEMDGDYNSNDLERENIRGTDQDQPFELNPQEKGEAFDTGRLFVRNLPYTANEDDLLEHFSQFGEISHVHLVVDKETKHSKGFGYVLYKLPESAVRALEELDNSIFQGRLLHVMPAKQQKHLEKLEVDNAVEKNSLNFKQQKEEERKASEASGNTRSWNSLFMRQDTVVENIARKYGISKSELLNPEADDLAVRIALGETHVIAETKKALMNAGINVAALEDLASGRTENIKRSNHVLLVKNLPYGSIESELVKMFGKFGSLDKVILPPTKTLALVNFLESAEARAAFKGLAYRRYGGHNCRDAPLYLEWAPDNILCSNHEADAGQDDNATGGKDKRLVLEQNFIELAEDIDPDRLESRSVFVKNLNFSTAEESLRKHFSENLKSGNILSAKIKRHIKNGKNLSRGFGFLEFDSFDTAKTACTDLQGTILEGHALKLELCHVKKGPGDGTTSSKLDKEKSSTKLIVRNIAFEATKKDLKQLFSPFGQIKHLRLPKKFDGKHRGFAFVEYVTKQEAQSAFDALSSSHLYGRHLVLERAKEGETLEELRARTAAQFGDGQDGVEKPSKKRKHLSVDEANVKFQKMST
ncbi:putative RNA-binding protein 19 [Nymphaea thermarum]|nr:putative RNA-binding protein 19 [Nymphaea thermarum]